METFDSFIPDQVTRRAFLGRASRGLGAIALAGLINPSLLCATAALGPGNKWGGVISPPHFPQKAKRIIYLCMAGGPSHLETLDYKPKLAEMDGKPMPESFTKGQPIAQLQGATLKCLGPLTRFRKRGQAGQEVS